jgi:hypothetical protein
MYMGMSDRHSSTVPLVLNLESGAITPQFHMTFNDWFATVVADLSKFPDFDSPDWQALFGESAYQYLPTDEDDEVQEVSPPTEAEQAREARLDQLDALHRPTSSDCSSDCTNTPSACSSCSGDSSNPFGATSYTSLG